MDDAELGTRLETESPAGAWLSLPSPSVAEVVAGSAVDFAVIDTEHAPTTVETVEAMVRAIEAAPGEVAPLVRTPWNDHVRIKRLLDTGVAGIIAPQVETRAETESFLNATRYPPGGRRGVAAGRASDYGRSFAEYLAQADDRLVRIVQIESGEAVEAVSEITDVVGLDSVFVGPADLSAALGVSGAYRDPQFREAIETVIADSSVPVGTLATDPELVEYWTELGFDYLVVGSDMGFLQTALDSRLERYQQVTE